VSSATRLPDTPETSLRLVIWNREPLAGCLYARGDRTRNFRGWIELAAAIASELEIPGSLPDASGRGADIA
jgi:hypothetical protein